MSYLLEPNRNTIIHFSGGRSSGYMLYHILDAYDGVLPENVKVAFTNTGKEREETLEFIQNCSVRWDVPVTWLEYWNNPEAKGGRKDPKHLHKVVNFESASRDGEPFKMLIDSHSFLPSAARRICTVELKIETTNRWVRRELGWDLKETYGCLGIRYDEPKRWNKALFEECHTVYPMVLAKVTVEDVNAFWKTMPFDLGINSEQGNCDLCFLKNKGKLLKLMREEPERAEWWIRQEQERTAALTRPTRNTRFASFIKNQTYENLLRLSKMPDPETFFDMAEDDADCFCGN